MYSKIAAKIDRIKGLNLHLNELRRFIIMHFGGDQRTISGYLNTMLETGLIREVEHLRYDVIGITKNHEVLNGKSELSERGEV